MPVLLRRAMQRADNVGRAVQNPVFCWMLGSAGALSQHFHKP